MNYEERLEWCKARAREYLDRGDCVNAYASFASDMIKHPETANHPALVLGVQLMVADNRMRDDPAEMRKFIEGFH